MGVAGIDNKKHTAHKHVKVTHVHAKPHRKRHYALLIASAALGVSVVAFLFVYFNQAAISRAVATETIGSIFGNRTVSDSVSIRSSYGFSVSYSQNQYYASAIDADTGGLFVGDELSSARAYDTIRLSTQATGYTADTNSVRLTYYPHDAAVATSAEVEQRYIVAKQADASKLTKVSTSLVDVHGVSFQRTEWSRSLAVGKLNLKTTFVTYAANVNSHPMTVIVYQGLQSAAKADEFMNGMTFSAEVTATTISPTAAVTEKHSLAERIINTLFGVQVASAASAAPSYTASERVSATYGPAVVKVYNVYCADLMLDGNVIYENYLNGGTGSGFIVSGDGYIATNGHVVVNDAREEIIRLAFTLNAAGNSKLFEYLVNLTDLQNSDIAGKSQTDIVKIITQALYGIDKAHFAFKNMQTNLLVGLGSEQVDIESLVAKTQNHQQYTEEDTIKRATVESYDYAGELLPLLTGTFTSSDAALIKLTSGSNYPMVKIGAMADAAQGSNLNIMGFPGTGSSTNGIVSKTVTSATLTTGKVSAQKTDSGGRSIIETDTEIGHGNSGGPAFNDDGEVIGIATYTSDTGEAGDGVLNYIRNIADFTALADKKVVNYKSISGTQAAWNRAINLFYQAHYKAAIPVFKQVKQLYPSHPQVDAMIASSEKHIANGDNIDEFPIIPVVIVAVVAVIGAVVAVIFITTHKKKHAAYMHGVTTGQIQPMTPGMAPQIVAVPQQVPMVPVAAPMQPVAVPAQPVAVVAPQQDPAPVPVSVSVAQPSQYPTTPIVQPTPPAPAQDQQPAATADQTTPSSQWPFQQG